jgi:hypothetical protein
MNRKHDGNANYKDAKSFFYHYVPGLVVIRLKDLEKGEESIR